MCETVKEFALWRCTLQDASPLSPLHHTSHWETISLLDSEFRWRDHLKQFGLSLSGENVTPGLLSTTFDTLPAGPVEPNLSYGGNYDKWFFIFLAFSLENFPTVGDSAQKLFGGLTFTHWQRGRIRFKERTPNIFRGAFSLKESGSFLLSVKEMSSQRSGQSLSSWYKGWVIVWSLPWETVR